MRKVERNAARRRANEERRRKIERLASLARFREETGTSFGSADLERLTRHLPPGGVAQGIADARRRVYRAESSEERPGRAPSP
jgi:hypothetical protein